MRTSRRTLTGSCLWTLILLLLIGPAAALAQQQEADAELSATEQLALQQSRIADKYARLEQLMIRMAEIEAAKNPQRAALLKQAVQRSSQRLTRAQLNTVSGLLKPPSQLKRAVDEQEQVLSDMKELLELLLSENRADRLKDAQDEVRQFIKDVERLLRLQRGVQGRTEGGADPEKLAGEQERVADRTGELADRIQKKDSEDASEQENGSPASDQDEPSEQEGQKGGEEDQQEAQSPSSQGEPREASQGQDNSEQPSQGEPSEGKPSEGKPSEGDSSEGQSSEGQSSEGQSSEGQSSEGQSSEGEPSEGQPNQGQPSEGESSEADGSQQQDQSPQQSAQRRIQSAEQRMREAKKRLEEAKRNEALDEQEQARRELEKAKADLEEILRQLREEEVERMLALLEGRFRRMLEMQQKIYESTQQIAEIDPDDRDRQVEIRANKLSFEEGKLVDQADRVLLLLREEGSSVAFPESVEQMRDEMQQVSDRLADVQVGVITQAGEEEIIAALEEMIESLQKAQRDLEEQQQQQQQNQGPMDSEDMPLVDQLAELKMIRALQMRVNTRTDRLARLLEDTDDPVGQASDRDLQDQLGNLAERQERIHRVTRDIVVGKNK